MKSIADQLRGRGYLSQQDVEALVGSTDSELSALLRSDDAGTRSAAVRLLANSAPLEQPLIARFVDMLVHEKKLYTKLELGNALQRGGETSATSLVPFLGRVGRNQHRSPDPNEFKKVSFPLPRDIAARILARMDNAALPALLAVLHAADRTATLEALDAVGFICFYSSNGDTKQAALTALRALYPWAQDDELLRWKLVRCFQSFNNEAINTLLTGIEHNDPNPAIRQEAHRSLTVLAGRSKM